MTVRELIDELMKYPEDMSVYIKIPKRKMYQPLHEFSVGKGYYLDGEKRDKLVDVVSLRRGKLFY